MAGRWMVPGFVLGLGVLYVDSAAGSPQSSLDVCQKTVKSAAARFVNAEIKAVGSCLAKISRAVIVDNRPAGDAAATCVAAFRKLNNSADPNKTAEAVLTAKIVAKCDPLLADVEHTLQDVLGTGVGGVPQPLNAKNINEWCAQFGGDGSIDSVQEWISCIVASNKCNVVSAVSTHYPRALEWLDDVRPAMLALSPPPTDAVAALDEVNAAIEGIPNDNKPNVFWGPRCGDGIKNGCDQCDGSDFGGVSCVTLGFLGGTLGCTSGCVLNTSGCLTNLCGNGIKDGIESCDGSDVGGQSCVTLGFLGGTLACDVDCKLDTSACLTDLCGNGIKDGIESCDSSDLGGTSCASLGFAGGTLACNAQCGFDTSGCIATLCGNGVQQGAESCDGADLAGQTCASLGYSLGGTLTCTAGCCFNTTGCMGQALPETGQMTCWDSGGLLISCTGTGHDGEIKAGAPIAYIDNGNGTITDTNTKLMWEKKGDAPGLNYRFNFYTWDDAFAVHVAGLNTASFAGYNDWRLPNAKELQTIVNYEFSNPSISPAFNTGCGGGCGVLTCSCTSGSAHWTSTSYNAFPALAWYVLFDDGFVTIDNKGGAYYVRAVRGGL